MKLALRLNLYRAADLAVPVDIVQRGGVDRTITRCGARRPTVPTRSSPLAYLAAFTERIKLGTGGRATRGASSCDARDARHDDRRARRRWPRHLGIGVSGPQIVEGWYGQPWGHPTPRLRDYVDDHPQGARPRRRPSVTTAPRSPCRTADPGRSARARRCVRSCTRSPASRSGWRSGGPKNTELCAEIADGWLPMGLGAGRVVARAARIADSQSAADDRPTSKSSPDAPCA